MQYLSTVNSSICKGIKSCTRMASSLAANMIAVCQMTSTSDKKENFDAAANLIKRAANSGAKVIFLPECFDYVGESNDNAIKLAEPISGPTISNLKSIARENEVWLSLGGFHEKGLTEGEARIFNSHLLIDDKGETKAVYRKAHLFDVDMGGGAIVKESDYVKPGTEVMKPLMTPVGRIGLQICYDLRFPELSLVQKELGAELLTFPSAFTVHTGLAHWEVLLRARAIENQCYVVAAAQIGKHNSKRQSFGHAMVVDPWGAVIAQCSDGPGFCLANVDLDYLRKIRRTMPVWKHRRYDLYNSPLKTET